jgi:hypothetical protein
MQKLHDKGLDMTNTEAEAEAEADLRPKPFYIIMELTFKAVRKRYITIWLVPGYHHWLFVPALVMV